MLRGVGVTALSLSKVTGIRGLNAAHSGLAAGSVSSVAGKSEPVRKGSPDRKDAFVIYEASKPAAGGPGRSLRSPPLCPTERHKCWSLISALSTL